MVSIVGPVVPVCRNRKALKEHHFVGNFIRFFDEEFKKVYTVEASAVVHFPPAAKNITRFVRCRDYSPYEKDKCGLGERCNFIHVDIDIDLLPCTSTHMNYIVKSPTDSIYARLSNPPETVKVYRSPGEEVYDMVPGESIIHTAAFRDVNDSIHFLRCPLFQVEGYCPLAEDCPLVHVLTINPELERSGSYKLVKPRVKRNPYPALSMSSESNYFCSRTH